MSVVAAAVIGSTVVGVASSRSASKQQAKGIQKGLDQSSALAQQAREDVMGLFDRSARSARMGSKGAFDFYKRVAPDRIAPYLQGNEQARQAITIGAQQANNAILGQPVDMGAINQPGIQPDMSYLEEAELPDYRSANIQAETANQPEQAGQRGAVAPDYGNSILGKMMTKGVQGMLDKTNPDVNAPSGGGGDPEQLEMAKLEASLGNRPGGRR